MDLNKDLTIRALMESNELLGQILVRYRRAITYLRQENGKLRRLKNIQIQNDQEFRGMCQDDTVAFPYRGYEKEIDTDVTSQKALLPEAKSSRIRHT